MMSKKEFFVSKIICGSPISMIGMCFRHVLFSVSFVGQYLVEYMLCVCCFEPRAEFNLLVLLRKFATCSVEFHCFKNLVDFVQTLYVRFTFSYFCGCCAACADI